MKKNFPQLEIEADDSILSGKRIFKQGSPDGTSNITKSPECEPQITLKLLKIIINQLTTLLVISLQMLFKKQTQNLLFKNHQRRGSIYAFF